MEPECAVRRNPPGEQTDRDREGGAGEDPYALPFTAAIALATGLLFGIFPAFHGTRRALVTALKHDAGQPDGARSAAGFRSGLVMAQFALAAMLLVVTGLFVQSLRNVSGADLGIRTHDVATFRLWPGLNGYGDEQARAFFERLEAELAAQPGVTGATLPRLVEETAFEDRIDPMAALRQE